MARPNLKSGNPGMSRDRAAPYHPRPLRLLFSEEREKEKTGGKEREKDGE